MGKLSSGFMTTEPRAQLLEVDARAVVKPRSQRHSWIEQILKMCESDRPGTEIAENFGTTVKTSHQMIIKHG